MEVFNEQQFSEFRLHVICFARSIITAYKRGEERGSIERDRENINSQGSHIYIKLNAIECFDDNTAKSSQPSTVDGANS